MEKISLVYKEEKYGKFKMLLGNRIVEQRRVDTIKKSIIENGWVMNPIVINENWEIIDGQGRFTALRELNMPIYFVVARGAGINECRALNIKQKNWTVKDYISSYANTGNQSYQYLHSLIKEFPEIDTTTILDTAAKNGATVKTGNMKLNQDDYEKARKILQYLTDVRPVIESVNGGRKSCIYKAIIFCISKTDIDTDRLRKQILTKGVEPVVDLQNAIRMIDDVYNKGFGSKNKTSIIGAFDEAMKRGIA